MSDRRVWSEHKPSQKESTGGDEGERRPIGRNRSGDVFALRNVKVKCFHCFCQTASVLLRDNKQLLDSDNEKLLIGPWMDDITHPPNEDVESPTGPLRSRPLKTRVKRQELAASRSEEKNGRRRVAAFRESRRTTNETA